MIYDTSFNVSFRVYLVLLQLGEFMFNSNFYLIWPNFDMKPCLELKINFKENEHIQSTFDIFDAGIVDYFIQKLC